MDSNDQMITDLLQHYYEADTLSEMYQKTFPLLDQ